MLCTRVTKTPIIVDVPKARVDRVDGSESDEYRFVWSGFVDAVDAKCHVEYDGCEVFATVEEMGKFVPCIPVSTDTLQGTPNAG